MIRLNGIPIKFGEYPNAETNLTIGGIIAIVKDFEEQKILWKYEGDQSIWHLIVLKRYLDEIGCLKIRLAIPYMPYSRMDRPNRMYAFTLKSLCEIINGLGFSSVRVYEPHSHMTRALLNRCQTEDVTHYLVKRIEEDDLAVGRTPGYAMCYPDDGAAIRYSNRFKFLVILGHKTRNFATGAITGMTVDGDIGNANTVIIVDDLCSRGGTFVLAAKLIKDIWPDIDRIILAVAHCETTMLEGDIPTNDLISAVYTTNSIISAEDVQKKLASFAAKKITVVDMF